MVVTEEDDELARWKHQVRLNQRRISQLETDLRQAQQEREALGAQLVERAQEISAICSALGGLREQGEPLATTITRVLRECW